MSQCFVSPTASRDLDAIGDYFVARNIEAGERLLREFVKKCENLLKFPNMGRSYDRIKPGLRGVPLDGYIIFYRVVENGIEILRVVSGYQEFEALFPEET
ncbi:MULTISPECIES: type II toxin-antitoxin system RelE/ParE family toxin [unclassified Microcoleus]|uniref:type II toxin-antitoxin system RelE/ParE family toxin n=1 Tax=unclassified Microcoleus TaxID=2642155 RepID=UPI002FD354C3